MADLKLTPDIVDVIDRSTLHDCSLTLPGQLDRKLYQKVNVALEAAGGKWNKKLKCHVFPGCPRDALGLVITKGVVVDEKKARQAFYTPPELADRVVAFAEVEGHHVLEPSAGHGNLADSCIRAGAKGVSVVEIDQAAFSALATKRYVGVCGDFLLVRPRKHFLRIVMNPPFTKGQDVKHIRRALLWLAPGGILVSVMPDRFGHDSYELIRHFDLPVGAKITSIPLPEKSFKESGTTINTFMVKIALPR